MIARNLIVESGVGNDLAGLKVQVRALTTHRISLEHSGHPLQIHGQLPQIVRLAVGHAQPNLLYGSSDTSQP